MREQKNKTQDVFGTVALAGNPNVGKSTLFNTLTGLHQHTGNWTGKTVRSAQGEYKHEGKTYRLLDLPGTYSIHPHAAEEEVARDFLASGDADVIAVVCDAGMLERQLILVLQIMLLTRTPMVVALNFMQEADRKGRRIKTNRLQAALGVPVVCVDARSKRGLSEFCEIVSRQMHREENKESSTPLLDPCGEIQSAEQITALADKIATLCTQAEDENEKHMMSGRRLDRLFVGKWTAFPIMLLFLGLLFWITMVGANAVSDWLMSFFSAIEARFCEWGEKLLVPSLAIEALIFGVFRTLAWVIAVMLPPMAIFFPLFTLLEDFGYLPRIAFNLDRFFARSRACGKQALTMCMGLGCNAVGVSGCRIIDSPRERRIAMLTNAMIPCNGRFPTLIALTGLFLASTGSVWDAPLSALVLIGCMLLCVGMTLLSARFLSATLLRGETSSFVLELPPYRPPRVCQVLIRSVLDRTLFVLGRAVAVAAPAGLLLWGLANVRVQGVTLLLWVSRGLDPLGHLLGMDGAILLAFLLALPANEILIPVLMMIYRSASTLEPLCGIQGVKEILIENGWTTATAVCVVIFLLFHWPCATTVWTIRRESGTLKDAALAVLLPTLVGGLLCMIVNASLHFVL